MNFKIGGSAKTPPVDSIHHDNSPLNWPTSCDRVSSPHETKGETERQERGVSATIPIYTTKVSPYMPKVSKQSTHGVETPQNHHKSSKHSMQLCNWQGHSACELGTKTYQLRAPFMPHPLSLFLLGTPNHIDMVDGGHGCQQSQTGPQALEAHGTQAMNKPSILCPQVLATLTQAPECCDMPVCINEGATSLFSNRHNDCGSAAWSTFPVARVFVA